MNQITLKDKGILCIKQIEHQLPSYSTVTGYFVTQVEKRYIWPIFLPPKDLFYMQNCPHVELKDFSQSSPGHPEDTFL